jgi:hypothetical protein
MKFITLIQAMYDKAFSSVQIKSYVAGPFPLQRSVRQGCPVSNATIRFGFESADTSGGSTSYGHQNRTSDKA